MAEPRVQVESQAGRDAAVLDRRARLLARPLPTRIGDDLAGELLGLDAGEGRFAVPVADVVTVLGDARPTRLPEASAWLAGVAGVRGHVVAVIEPDGFLGAMPAPPSGQRTTLVVVSDGSMELGLLVHGLDRTIGDGSGELEGLPAGTPADLGRAVLGVVDGRHLLSAAGLIAAVRGAIHPSITPE